MNLLLQLYNLEYKQNKYWKYDIICIKKIFYKYLNLCIFIKYVLNLSRKVIFQKKLSGDRYFECLKSE